MERDNDMSLLWMNLLIVFSFAFLSRWIARPTPLGAAVPIRPNKLFVFGSLASLVTVSGLRANIGDTYFYKHAYESNDFTLEYILSEKDIGFGFLQMVLKQFSDDPQLMLFVTALVTNLLIVIVFYYYSRMIEISLYVYITGGLFLVSMNGIRQVLAAAIAFTAIRFLIQGRFFPFACIVLLASLFHQTALILLVLYFVVRFPAWSRVSIGLLVLSVFIVIGFDYFSALLFSAIEDTQYGHYKDFQEGGASVLRAVVSAIPLIIAYLGREKLKEIFEDSDYIVNMALLGFVFMVISTQNWIFARFSIYFELYQLILIAWVVKLFHKRDERVIYYGILVCYAAYFYFESVISLQIQYRSDFLSF